MYDRQTIHGSLISIFGFGILIQGDPGSGKSQLCIEAVRRGHKLVADDAVELSRVGDHLIGRAPDITSGLIELKTVGIVDIRQAFGNWAFVSESKIDICVELFDRTRTEENEIARFLNVEIRRFVFPFRRGSVPDLEKLARNFEMSAAK